MNHGWIILFKTIRKMEEEVEVEIMRGREINATIIMMVGMIVRTILVITISISTITTTATATVTTIITSAPITPTDVPSTSEDDTLSPVTLHGIYPDLELPAMVTSEDFWEAAVRREVERVTEIVKAESQSVYVESDECRSGVSRGGDDSDVRTSVCDLDPTTASNTATGKVTASNTAAGTITATVSATVPSSSELVTHTHILSLISQDNGSDIEVQKGGAVGEENNAGTDKDKGKDSAVILEQKVSHDDIVRLAPPQRHSLTNFFFTSYFI